VLKHVLAMSVVAILVAAPVRAQTYDPSYPVCLHVFGELEGERMDCIFTSLAQCAASASGRSATCLINPYFAHAQLPPRTGRRVPRPRQ
jgi:hypothetical protein